MRNLVFTVNLGGYDRVRPMEFKAKNTDYIMFTDGTEEVKGWKTVTVSPGLDVKKRSREIKICIHKFVKGYKMYIYTDANYLHFQDVTLYANKYFSGGMLIHTHPKRNCLFQEARKVVQLRRGDTKIIQEQTTYYSMTGMVRNYGLFQNGFFIRDNKANKFCEQWYAEIDKYSYRDQISLPFCIFKYKPPITVMHSLIIKRFLTLEPHRIIPERRKEDPPRVWYFTPGRGDKNLGRAYNEHCQVVPDGDWICIRDGDTMFLNPFWSKQIEDIILKNGSKYNLISCMTNRLGLDWQLPYGLDKDPDILNHAERAEDHYERYYDTVIPSKRETAGLFMLFPKTTWEEVRFLDGLNNDGVFIDYAFSKTVKNQLGGLGIAKGIYLFHLYRLNRSHARDIEHLNNVENNN